MNPWSSRAGVLAGLRETRRYVLSHHEPHDWDRCHVVDLPQADRTVRVCARCSGIYPGIALGIIASQAGVLPVSLAVVAVLPAFTVGERMLEAWTEYRGSNPLRTATGFLLGIGYGMGVVGLTRPGTRVGVFVVGVAYAIVGALLLWSSPAGPQ